MKGLARQRHILPVLVLGGMNFVLPVFSESYADELPKSDAEKISYAEIKDLQELLAKQNLQLAAHQKLIISQQKELDRQSYICNYTCMCILSLRNFPPSLLHKVKVQAAVRGITMRQLVIDALEREFKEGGSSKSTRGKVPRKQ